MLHILCTEFISIITMPTGCAAYRCSNSSNKGYTAFRFPSDTDLCGKWVAALGKNFDWRPTTSHRICEVHFDQKDLSFVAGRKQLCKGAIPRYFCTCQYETKMKKCTKQQIYKAQKDHAYSMKGLETGCVYSYDASKKLPLQDRSINTLPHYIYASEYAHKGNKIASSKYAHTDHCPLLKNPISTKQLRTESNTNTNKNELNTDINNEFDINSKQAIISEIEALPTDDESLKLKLNETRVIQTSTNGKLNCKLNETIAENKALKEQLERLIQQINNSSAGKLTSRPYKYSNESVIKGLNLWTACGTTKYNRVRKTLGVELPSPRTLQMKIQNIPFNPGMQI